MKKNKIILIIIIIIVIVISIFLSTGKVRTDIYLKDFIVSDDNKIITLKIGVTGSSGYVRKMKSKLGGDNYYLTFYSTFGINSKLNAKDTYILEINSNATEIFFYTGYGGYKKVLQKDKESNEWILINN